MASAKASLGDKCHPHTVGQRSSQGGAERSGSGSNGSSSGSDSDSDDVDADGEALTYDWTAFETNAGLRTRAPRPTSSPAQGASRKLENTRRSRYHSIEGLSPTGPAEARNLSAGTPSSSKDSNHGQSSTPPRARPRLDHSPPGSVRAAHPSASAAPAQTTHRLSSRLRGCTRRGTRTSTPTHAGCPPFRATAGVGGAAAAVC